jgi:Tfp pilus assembly protein PilE
MSATTNIFKRTSVYVVVIIACAATYLAYENFRLRTDMAATAAMLKSLANDVSTFKKTNGKLIKKNKELSNSNKKLLNRHASIKSRIKARNKKVNSITMSRIAKKFATAPSRMVPLLGIGITVTTTANEIHDSCNDMSDRLAFEQVLFGNAASLESETLCGVDVESKLQESALVIDADMKKLLESSQAKYDVVYKNLGGYLHYLEERSGKSYDDFIDKTGGFIYYLKEQSVSPHQEKSPVKYDQTTTDFLKYFYYDHKLF